MDDETPLFKNLPVHFNLGLWPDPTMVIGWASAVLRADGTTKLEIILDAETSKQLTNLVEVFDLKAIGFAGIKRKAIDGSE